MRAHTQDFASDQQGMEVSMLLVTDTRVPNAASRFIRELASILSYCSLNCPDDMNAVLENLQQVNEYAKTHIFMRGD